MNNREIFGKLIDRAMLAALALLIFAAAGCSSGNGGYVSMSQAEDGSVNNGFPASAAESKVVGVYEGTSLASCNVSLPNRCNAQQIIRITLVQEDSGLKGNYRCSYGTMNCYNMNETGKVVKASVNGNQMTARVQMPDGTSCVYTARMNGESFSGGYSCYGGGTMIEAGSWKGRRLY
ncbi:hypothetical protein IMX07_14580 [bacterium]|nr:hypothetical protein [bacterium]